MNFRSHSKKEIEELSAAGERIWALDTGADGLDDVLVGREERDVWSDVEHWLDGPVPAHWTLDPLDQ